MLMPSASNVGLMLGPASLPRLEEFGNHVSNAGMNPILVAVNARDNPIKVLEPAIKRADVFIPVPDSRLINISTAKWILQLSYRYKVPVVAYSRAYLKAGALAAVYTSPENVAHRYLSWWPRWSIPKKVQVWLICQPIFPLSLIPMWLSIWVLI